ncbi:MAG: CGNR zinc finger domain-containing protein [Rubrobacteraceae bacterium]|nr:CGNR zinc finger domain-containing protein [Rubrobacteraceae bacterium]
MDQRIPEGEVPDEVRLVNEFLNTLDLETFGEHAGKPDEEREGLRSPERLGAWLVGRGLLGREETVRELDLDLAVKVRDALRSAASSNSSPARGRSDTAGVSFDELPLVLRIGGASKPELASREGGVKGALGRILADVAVAASKGTWARIKICAAEDCRWAYYDHSKSLTGRWCAMETCGNRHKTRRYRRKKRGSAQSGG